MKNKFAITGQIKVISVFLVLVSVVISLLVTQSCQEGQGKTVLSNEIEKATVPELPVALATHVKRHYNQSRTALIDSLIERFHARTGFHGTVLIAEDGQNLYQKSIGFGNMRDRIPLDSNSVFQLASVSKQFTAVAILMLMEKGLLDLHDSVVKYIPELPYEQISIHQLLTHTAGLPNYMWLIENHWHADTAPDNEGVIKMLARHKLPLYFRPGSRHHYSNTGYMLLASIVERVSGQRFDEFLHQNVFEPLEMKNSYVFSSTYNLDVDRVNGYRLNGRGRFFRVTDDVNDGAVGDKGIYATASDLLKWDNAITNAKLISEESLEKAFSPVVLSNGRSINYGYGWRLIHEQNKETIYHNGLWHGFRTTLRRYPQENKTLIFLNNTNCRCNGPMIRALENIILEQVKPPATLAILKTLYEEGMEEAKKQYLSLKETYADEYIFGREHFFILGGLLLDFEKEDIANHAFSLATEIYDNYEVLNEEMAMEDDPDNENPLF